MVFTADTNRQAYIRERLVPAAATVHVPYFFDAAAFAAPAAAVSPGFEIVYFGTFDWRGARSPETFLRALALFLQRHPEARTQTRFRFYGNWLADHDRFISELNLGEVVSIQPAVGYAEYLEKGDAEVPFWCWWCHGTQPVHAQQIVDYFGARRPILAFVRSIQEMLPRFSTQAGQSQFTAVYMQWGELRRWQNFGPTGAPTI